MVYGCEENPVINVVYDVALFLCCKKTSEVPSPPHDTLGVA